MLEDAQIFLLKFLNNTRERKCYDANDKESQVCRDLFVALPCISLFATLFLPLSIGFI